MEDLTSESKLIMMKKENAVIPAAGNQKYEKPWKIWKAGRRLKDGIRY